MDHRRKRDRPGRTARPEIFHDTHALSEIVGTLLLLLIVVGAAATFAVFVQAEQEERLEQDALENARALERLEILRLDPEDSDLDGAWDTLRFTVGNLRAANTILTGPLVNDHPIRPYTLERIDPSTGLPTADLHEGNDEIVIMARERFDLIVDLDAAHWNGAITLTEIDHIELTLFTGYANKFTRTFLPPNAIAKVTTEQQWDADAGTYGTVLILDGTHSGSVDGSPVVRWEWSVDGGPSMYGAKVRADITATGGAHTITLIVRTADGLYAQDTLSYTY